MLFLRAVSEQIQIVKIQSVESSDLSCSLFRTVDVDAGIIWRLHSHEMFFSINRYDIVIIRVDPLSDPVEFIFLAKTVKPYGFLRIN